MLKPITLLLLLFIVAGCSRSPAGLYQSVGSEDKFRMTLELLDAGQARFTTRSNLGNPTLDRSVESSMSLSTAKWTREGKTVLVTGAAQDGKSITYRFASQENGDLIWVKNGARLVRAR